MREGWEIPLCRLVSLDTVTCDLIIMYPNVIKASLDTDVCDLINAYSNIIKIIHFNQFLGQNLISCYYM